MTSRDRPRGMRMFAAVVPPDDVIAEVEEFLAPRREAAPFRWTAPDTWHVTLAFMAEVPERCLDDLVDRLERAGRRRTPFALRLAGGGAFPNPARAKVVYAPVVAGAAEGEDPDALEELRRLAIGARAAATKAGAPPAGAAFTPHVTLARLNRPMEATRWLQVLDGFSSASFRVVEFALVQSFLGEGPRNRPRYETVAVFPLGR